MKNSNSWSKEELSHRGHPDHPSYFIDLERRIQSHLKEGKMNPENPSIDVETERGLWWPSLIMNDPELCYAEKHLLCLVKLMDRSIDTGVPCFASNAWFGKQMGISAKTVANRLTRLVKLGYVIQLGYNGHRRFLVYNKSGDTPPEFREKPLP